MMTRIKTPNEIDSMRQSGAMLAAVLKFLEARLLPEMTTKDLADMAAKELKALGGEPAFLGYQGFPDVLCVSVNEEVVHGIPSSDKVIRNGDIVSMDFGVIYKGMITDSALTKVAGTNTDSRVQSLVSATEKSLTKGIEQVKSGCSVGDIAEAVQTVLEREKLGIVRELVGHGVGHELHEDPNIPNYGKKGRGMKLQAGMTIAIEPMATLGNHAISIANDGWTVSTRDGLWSAHFEHTILITDNGSEVLTRRS